MHVSTSTKNSRTIDGQSSSVSTRTQNARSSSNSKSTHGRKGTSVASKHSVKSQEHYSKDLNAQSLPSISHDIDFDLQDLTLTSQSSNSPMTPASVQYSEPLESYAVFYHEYADQQSTYLSSGDRVYTHSSSSPLTPQKDLNPIERYLEEDVTERYSIFAINEESSSHPHDGNSSGNGGGLGTESLWRYS